jgi:hypothetical protein
LPQSVRPSIPVFAIAPYEADATGHLQVVLPSHCVFAKPDEGRCPLRIDHRRHRKTGPCFPLAVVSCRRHPTQRYTLYPPGHVPYGRQALASVSPSGPLLLDAETRQVCWDGTVFQAALDAADGVRWREDSPAHDPRRRRTQGRHLELAERLLGVHRSLPDRTEEQVVSRLQVAMLTVRDAAARGSTSWTERALAVLVVLAALRVDGALLGSLLSAGLAVGLWARPCRWEVRHQRWERARELPAPSPVRAARDPPTNSQGADQGVGAAASRP